MEKQRCSATVITFNEEANIAECLASLVWADEIVVVDSGSTDRTVALARQFTERVVIHPWPGHKEQKNFAIDQTTWPWVFSLDADERVPAALQARVVEILSNPTHDGYRFPRQNFFLGKWMRHGGWFPDTVLRLFRKDEGRFGGLNPHDKVIVRSGRVADIPLPLLHYTYPTFRQYVAKQFPYAEEAAQELRAAGKAGRAGPTRIAGKTAWKFIETYLLKQGCLDGVHGLIAALGSSYLTFLRETRLWELKREGIGQPTREGPRRPA